MPIKYLKTISSIFLLLFSSQAAAFWETNPTDKSLEYLSHIMSMSSGDLLMVDLMGKLNAIVLALGTIVVSYIAMVGILNTTKDGETLGKKWSSIWIPLRVCIGMMLMAPTPGTGFSVLQFGVKVVINQSVYAANTLFNSTIKHIGTGFTLNKTPVEEIYTASEMQPFVTNVLQSSVCIAYMQNKDVNKNYTIYRSANKKKIIFGNKQPDPHPNPETKNLCGEILIHEKDKSKLDLKYAAIMGIQKEIQPLAAEIANINADEITTHEKRKNFVKSRIQPGYLDLATKKYNNIMVELLPSPEERDAELKKIKKASKNNGWITIGSFYPHATANLNKILDFQRYLGQEPSSFNVLRDYKKIHDNFPTSPKIENAQELKHMLLTASKVMQHTLQTERLYLGPESSNGSYLNSLYNAIGNAIDDSDITNNSASGSLQHLRNIKARTAKSLLKAVGIESDDAAQYIQGSIADLMNPPTNVDPIVFISSFGTILMNAAEFSWVNVLLPHITGDTEKNDENSVASKKQISSPLQTMITLGLGLLWGAGAGMGIYIPLIPYIIFTTSVFGWMVAVVEAIVAAPIMALGIISPAEGELGKAGPGIMMITNIFLRPMLLVLGFVITVRIMKAVVLMINFSFGSTAAISLPGLSLMGTVAVLMIYIGFLLAIVNKCSTIIVLFADKVLKIIGASPESFREEEFVGKAKQTFDAGKGNIERIVEGQSGRVSDFIERATKEDPKDTKKGS